MSSTSAERQPLDRARIVAAATTLADSAGIEAVSMRSVSTALGVVPMALYKHVADKRDLISAMVDAAVSTYAQPKPGTGWKAAIRERLLSAHRVLADHPWLRPAMEQATRQTPTILSHMNAVAGEFITHGFTADLAHYAMHALGHRIWGFSPEAFSGQTTPSESPREHVAEQESFAAAFPHIAAIALDAAQWNPNGACDEQAEFAFTLDLLLDAFERLKRSRWQSTPFVRSLM